MKKMGQAVVAGACLEGNKKKPVQIDEESSVHSDSFMDIVRGTEKVKAKYKTKPNVLMEVDQDGNP